MISVNTDRLKNPANTSKKKNKPSHPQKKGSGKKTHIALSVIIVSFFLFGAWQTGIFQAISYGIDNIWNTTTKAMGIRLETVQLVGYGIGSTSDKRQEKRSMKFPRDEILKALGLSDVQPGEYPLMALDPGHLRKQLENLPWVQAAAVQRVLPSTIRIHIVPRTAFVLLQEEGRTSMLDSFGNTLPMQPSDLNRPILTVSGKGAFNASLDLINILAEEPNLLNHIKIAKRISERRWNIHLKNGLLIKMPEEKELKAWKKLAELTYQQDLFNYAVKSLDLRYPDHLVIQGDFRPSIQQPIPKGGA